MKARWSVIMLLPFAFSFTLLTATQFVFVQRSLYSDLGMGRMGDTLQLANYYKFFSDSFYL